MILEDPCILFDQEEKVDKIDINNRQTDREETLPLYILKRWVALHREEKQLLEAGTVKTQQLSKAIIREQVASLH